MGKRGHGRVALTEGQKASANSRWRLAGDARTHERGEHRRESATAPAGPCELARTARGASDQGQVGNRRGHEDLEQSLAATEIACLSNAQLDEPSQSMLDHLTLLAEIIELRAVLPRPSRLEQGLMRVKGNSPSLALVLTLEALGS